jgi:DNA polymerase III delta prime subunit
MGHKTIIPSDLNPLCSRVKRIFSLFAKNPSTLQHLLLYGPPGSGKTTTVEWLLEQIWGASHMKIQTCRILNAADERSLDAIRAKIIPFVNTDWREPGDKRPRFLVLDECETLTESAQLALRPFLDRSPSDVCIIFICNSLSRVQLSLRTRCLRVRFDPPSVNNLQNHASRGDLRGARVKRNDIATFVSFLYGKKTIMTTFELIQASIFYCSTLKILDDNIISMLYPLMHISADTLPDTIKNIHLNAIKKSILNKLEKNFTYTSLLPTI